MRSPTKNQLPRLRWKPLFCASSIEGAALGGTVSADSDHVTISGTMDVTCTSGFGMADGQGLGDLAVWFSLAMRSLRRGWSLFDRRCEGR
ncbi:hypothetical protein AB0383_07165 [Amycolatopsis sp. NPDC051373]|uniref:hypothetical protein n=1 Tax=Amycolatopsis sp. NPDC051373 TaxID=3155801 RepID=UPI00344FEEEF